MSKTSSNRISFRGTPEQLNQFVHAVKEQEGCDYIGDRCTGFGNFLGGVLSEKFGCSVSHEISVNGGIDRAIGFVQVSSAYKASGLYMHVLPNGCDRESGFFTLNVSAKGSDFSIS